jgi:hypothetical protein
MRNEVEVISQTCHEANRAFAAATGNPGLSNWANSSEAQKNDTRNRVTAELQRLRTAGGSTPPGNLRGGGDGDEEAIRNGIFIGIVQGFYSSGAGQQLQEAAA